MFYCTSSLSHLNSFLKNTSHLEIHLFAAVTLFNSKLQLHNTELYDKWNYVTLFSFGLNASQLLFPTVCQKAQY